MGAYSFTGSPVFITIGANGRYNLDAFGGQGGNDGSGNSGGRGAEAGGLFNFTSGQVIEIVVGRAGRTRFIGYGGVGGGGGGGGGTFVFLQTGAGTYQTLLVAGGGGGGYGHGGGGGLPDGFPGLPGGGGGGGDRSAGGSGPAGTGLGGAAGGYNSSNGGSGGGGAGAKGPGAMGGGAYGGGGGGGGSSRSGNFGGGLSSSGSSGRSPPALGGFGGGGGGAYAGGGGGGGGYTGGVGSNSGAGTGGTSFDFGTIVAAQTLAGANAGNGSLTLSLVPCYCRGTLIRTSRGEMPVEVLAIGDSVVTASGARRPIRWIGRRAYSRRFLASNPGAQPVRIRAGALAEGVPRRDLLVSADHAMFLDGMLVPAGCLVNGTTILRDRGPERLEYYHVELETHDVILAEGAPSETFMDDDSRGLFHNAAEFTALYPQQASPAWFCAPRVEHGPELEALRRRLSGVGGQAMRTA